MRLPSQLDRLRGGVVGEFAPALSPPTERMLSGFLKLDTNELVVKLIADDDAFDDTGFPLNSAAVGGRTEAGDVLLVDVRTRGRNQGNLLVARYHANAVILDVDFDNVDSDMVTAVKLRYHGLYDWQTEGIYEDDVIVEGGRTVGWKAELRFGQGTTAPLDDGFNLRISAGWSVGGEFDRRTFATPLTITIESDERRSIDDHTLRLDAVHSLLNMAHRDPVNSFRGTARLVRDARWCPYWDTNVMTSDARKQHSQEFPYFGIDDIGGVEGVARWVDLVLSHRRAVAPLVRHVLVPNQTPESRLLSTAAAMEAWVAAHRRTHAWAAKVKGQHLPAALIRTIDAEWHSWVGDSDRWIEKFWSSYQHLKHQPQDDLDPYIVHVLELSGRWLLTAALLDHVAGSNGPSKQLFGRSLSNFREEVRSVAQ